MASNFLSILFISFAANFAYSSQYQFAKIYDQKKLSSDDLKIKSCLTNLYMSQIQYHKSKGYFALLPNQLNLTRYKVCDGLEISTHFVSNDSFRMTAKFNNKIWSVDQSKNIQKVHR